MIDDASTEAAVQRDLLELAMRNAGRSVVAQVLVVALIVGLGLQAHLNLAAALTGALGVTVAAWRAWIAHQFRRPGRRTDAELRLARRMLEGNSLLAGLMWVAGIFGIYAHLEGTAASAFVMMVSGSVAVAASFMSLVGRAFALLVVPQLGALVLVSVAEGRVHSWPMAALVVIFGVTMFRAAREFTLATTRAVRHGLEVDASNEQLVRAKADADAANASLRAAVENANAANVAKSQFLATMSHEIRTPMNGVLGALELLRRSSLDTQQRRLVRTAASSGESLMAILNDVLDHSKIEAGKLTLSPGPVSLHAMARSVIALFRANADAKGLSLVLDIDPLAVDWVIADAQRLKQVLLNLVGNAIKFTEHGGVSLRLSGRPPKQGTSTVTFAVSDSGIGIAAEAMPHLFEPFHQIDGTRNRRRGGTGLGLTISQRIVEAMGSHLEVDSEPGRGSSFHFTLAVEIDPNPPAGEAFDSALAALDAPSSFGGTVLVVEDNPVNRIIAEEMLQSLGLQVVEAHDGAQALDVLARQRVDVVLMDCQMPVMDGYTATQRIRERESRQHLQRLPIVALTANAFDEDAAHARAAGMDAHLSKPYTRDQLREVLSTWL